MRQQCGKPYDGPSGTAVLSSDNSNDPCIHDRLSTSYIL